MQSSPGQSTAEGGASSVDVASLRTRLGYGLLLGIAGLVLCCLPVGLVGAWLPLSSLSQIEQVDDPSAQRELKTLAFAALICSCAATVLGALGYLFAFVAGRV